MRMRRKKNLEQRLENCGKKIIFMDREDRNYQVKDTESIIDFKKLFGNGNPVHLEIGCGKGQFAREIARQNPDINFLAVEKSSNVIVDAAEKAISQEIPNLYFLRGGAEYLECYIPKHSIARIYLNFSCPYPKKSYASHRLTHRNFLNIYEKLLMPEGEIHQKTDNRNFFEFSLEEFSRCGYTLKNISLDLHNSDFEGNIVTEYEQKFSEQGFPIYRLEAFK
ncbi:MAG: tRNA (guanosine(46)-N7)-methyltransferase TrmB [Oscillospiraceae bacterium]